MKLTLSVKFEPRDLWVGVYWDYAIKGNDIQLSIYLCLIPCFPLILRIIKV